MYPWKDFQAQESLFKPLVGKLVEVKTNHYFHETAIDSHLQPLANFPTRGLAAFATLLSEVHAMLVMFGV